MNGFKSAWESFVSESLVEEVENEDERMMKITFPVRRNHNDRSACIVSTGFKSPNHGQQLTSCSSDKLLSSAVEPSSRWARSASPIDISAVEEDDAADFTDTPWTIARRLALVNKAKSIEKPISPQLTLNLRAAVQDQLDSKKGRKAKKVGLQTSLKSAFSAQRRAQAAQQRQSGQDHLQSPSRSGEPTTSGKICNSNDTPASAFPATVPLVGPSQLNDREASINSEDRYAQQDYYRGSTTGDTAHFDVEPCPYTDGQSCVVDRTGHELSDVEEEDAGQRWASVQSSSDYLFQHSASPPPTTDPGYYQTGYENTSPVRALGNICGSMGVTSSMNEDVRNSSVRSLDSDINERGYPAFELEENESAYGSESYDSRPTGMIGAHEWEESEQLFTSKAYADQRYHDRAFGPIEQEIWEAQSSDHIPGSVRYDNRPAWSTNDRFDSPPRNLPSLGSRAGTFTPFAIEERRRRPCGASKVGSLSEYAKRGPARAPAYARGSAKIRNPPEVFHFKADKRKAQEVLHKTILKAKHSRSQQPTSSLRPSTPTELDDHDHLPPLKRPTVTALYEPTATLHEFKNSSSSHVEEEIQSPAVRSRAVRPALAIYSSEKKRQADVAKAQLEQQARHLAKHERDSDSKQPDPERQTVVRRSKMIVKVDLKTMTVARCRRLRQLLETQLSGPEWPPELEACIDQRLNPNYIDLCSSPE